MEDYGYKYIHKLPQFVTTLNSRKNCSIDSIPKDVKNSAFWSILYSKPLRETKKARFKTGDRVGSSKYDLPFSEGDNPQDTKSFSNCCSLLEKICNRHNKGRTGRVYPRWILSKRADQSQLPKEKFTKSWFQMHLCNYFQTTHWALLQTFHKSNWIWKVNGRLQFWKYSHHQSTKMLQRESSCFLTRNFQRPHNSTIWKLVLTFHYGHFWSPDHSHSRKTQSQRKLYHS